jgi:UDP-N-acetylmuramoylalanine--D-glutamate ligase
VKISELGDKSTLILGFGAEGRSSLRYLRSSFPEKVVGVADQLALEEMPADAREQLRQDTRLRLHLGAGYLSSLSDYDVVVKSPGIPVIHPEYQRAVAAGKIIASPTSLFFANFPGMVVGVTGTKGKSTTASLIHAILKRTMSRAVLLGNIGVPALDVLPQLAADAPVVFELSSHQLESVRQSPHIAVLLNVVPEHLDYYASFEQYVQAKANITRFQTREDFLVYDADHDVPRRIANSSAARKVACSLEGLHRSGCFLYGGWIACRTEWREPQAIIAAGDVPLLGTFNLQNVAAAVAVGTLLDVPADEMAQAVREFQPLEHRLEPVGEFDGVTYYNDSIATVPEAAVAALEALGGSVETLLLGGADRGLDFSLLARKVLHSKVKTLILFPPTGERIWQQLCAQDPGASSRLKHFFVESMEEAVRLAKLHAQPGTICLLSPASPSFGLFRDYRERGRRFKEGVRGSAETTT